LNDSSFAELNLHVYNFALGRFYDGVIWCLGPFVDDTRDYGLLRCCLALATRRLCRACIRAR
jgi:hypothetical protein